MGGRNLIGKVYEASTKLVDKALDATMAESAKPDERVLLERYEKLHRGNALAMADFVRAETSKRAQPGQRVNLLDEMRNYEGAMEALRRKYGHHRSGGGQ